MCKKVVLIIFLVFLAGNVFSQNNTSDQSDQQISDFSLAGYGDQGKKTWDLAGASADIFTDIIKLTQVVGNLYGEQEDVHLVSEKGDFDKKEGKVHLEDNVVITTSSGAKLTTDSLDWDRKNQEVSTKDIVNIEKESMTAVATGAKGEPTLNKVALEKDVRVDINPTAEEEESDDPQVKEKIIITCDGPLDIDYEKNIAVFRNNVKVERTDSIIYSDIMDVYFGKNTPGASESKVPGLMGNKIDKIVARGNVKIVRGENISYSEEAVYSAADKKITLTGRPKIVIVSTEDMKGTVSGDANKDTQ
ncbi:MAG: LPS export ABC transporter periplasmic protein LptC [Candidatus Omnitrophica bacterium]|nr:LPS export ABC transporter periplasmic protein LptC [Candidatus Omnitrophota bacterium]